MKHLLFILAIVICLQLDAQDDGPTMYQTIELTPKTGSLMEFREGVKAHNEKYHKEGDQTANVWMVNSGPRAGTMIWVMGPLNWSTFDTPMGDEHLQHWMENVGAHSEMGAWEYWDLVEGLTYSPDGLTPAMMQIRYFNILPDKRNNAVEQFGKVFEVYRKENMDIGMHVFANQAEAGDGRGWAILWQHDSWASLDKDRNWVEKFEAMHGDDSWDEFFENWRSAAEWKGMELHSLAAELSMGGSN